LTGASRGPTTRKARSTPVSRNLDPGLTICGMLLTWSSGTTGPNIDAFYKGNNAKKSSLVNLALDNLA